jgi:hypothetical protein
MGIRGTAALSANYRRGRNIPYASNHTILVATQDWGQQRNMEGKLEYVLPFN